MTSEWFTIAANGRARDLGAHRLLVRSRADGIYCYVDSKLIDRLPYSAGYEAAQASCERHIGSADEPARCPYGRIHHNNRLCSACTDS